MSSPSKKDLALSDLRNRVKSHALEIKELTREIDVTKEQLEACENELAKSVGSRAALENRLLEQEAAYNELNSLMKKSREEKRELVAELEKTSAEADRLNSLLHATGGSMSSSDDRSDVVRLHDRISQYRKEVEGLKKENETLNGIIKAKDRVIEESESAVAAAEEANASKRADLNVILDLKRQLKEMEERLGGEESQNKLADSENEHYRKMVGRKDEEIEALRDEIESQRSDVLNAQKLRAAADVLKAEAAAKMAEAVEMSEKARKAEADRVASGGFVPKDLHEAVVLDLQACREVVQAHEKGSRDGTVLAYRAARAATDARMRREIAQGLKAKRQLANVIGEYDYTLMFNEPPPSDRQMAFAEAGAEAAAAEEGVSSVEAVLAEREREVLALKDAHDLDRATLIARATELHTLQEKVVELEKVVKMEKMEGTGAQASTAGRSPSGTRVEVHTKSVGTSMSPMRSSDRTKAAAEPDVGETSPRNSPAAATSGEPRTTAPPTEPAVATGAVPVAGTGAAAGNRPPLSVSSEALASIVRSLVASKEAKLQVRHDDDDEGPEIPGEGLHTSVEEEGEDEALYQEAIAMLQEELARLTEQMMTETDVAARIRQQVGCMGY